MEILEYTSNAGIVKTQRKILSALILSFLGGVYIAFASEGSTMAAYNLLANTDTYGLGRVLAGAVFGTGLMLVVLAGAELFTGNSLIIVSVLDRKVTVKAMLLNWLLVYIGNFLGSLCIAMMMYKTGLFNSSGGLLGGMTIKIAAYKTALPFHSAFFLGVMCNWLVCLAIWVSYGAAETAGKALAIFFIICLFITSGFEHSIANMYYIPAGIFAKQNPQWLAMAQIPADQIVNLNWFNFIVKNLIPVTLGNIAGGSVMVGVLYWLSRALQNKKITDIKK
jgi:formate transporter